MPKTKELSLPHIEPKRLDRFYITAENLRSYMKINACDVKEIKFANSPKLAGRVHFEIILWEPYSLHLN